MIKKFLTWYMARLVAKADAKGLKHPQVELARNIVRDRQH